MKTTINFYDMTTLLYLVIKGSLSRCGLLDYILRKWRLVKHFFEWMLRGLGWVRIYGGLFWVGECEWGLDGALFLFGGGRWENILGGWVGVGVGALFDNARCMV